MQRASSELSARTTDDKSRVVVGDDNQGRFVPKRQKVDKMSEYRAVVALGGIDQSPDVQCSMHDGTKRPVERCTNRAQYGIVHLLRDKPGLYQLTALCEEHFRLWHASNAEKAAESFHRFFDEHPVGNGG